MVFASARAAARLDQEQSRCHRGDVDVWNGVWDEPLTPLWICAFVCNRNDQEILPSRSADDAVRGKHVVSIDVARRCWQLKLGIGAGEQRKGTPCKFIGRDGLK